VGRRDFHRSPDWAKLLAVPQAALSAEEQAYLDGTVEECAASSTSGASSGAARPAAGHLGLSQGEKILRHDHSKEYGGLGFSAYAHSESGAQIVVALHHGGGDRHGANSLGPGELLLQFGTREQRDYWLPRLADGARAPCFGLTSPEAGSDAASMVDTGIVTRGNFRGRDVLGIKLNWHNATSRWDRSRRCSGLPSSSTIRTILIGSRTTSA